MENCSALFGEGTSGIDRDDRARTDIVFGTIWYRILATGQSLDAQLVDDLVAVLAER